MRSLGLTLFAVAIGSRLLAAQATFQGIVKEGKSSPIAEAEVLLRAIGGGQERSLRAKSGSDGRFLISSIPAGDYSVQVRAIGYQPVEADAEFRGSDTVRITFELSRSVQKLEEVTVEGAAPPPVVGKMAAFEERRKAGLGRFLTRADLAKREHSTLSDALRMVAGMNLVRRPAECGDGFAAATGRGWAIKWEPWMVCGGNWAMKPACYMSVYLDGLRLWTWGNREIIDLDKLISIVGLEGVEVYLGPAQTPIQFQTTGSACGAILFWTRN
jgi:hypothetical protein